VPARVVTTRVAVPADAPEMARTLWLGFQTYRAFAPAGWSPTWSAEEAAAGIRDRLRGRGAWALLAGVAGEPAGHVALLPEPDRHDTVDLWQLFVRPAWFGTGLAPALHDAFVARAREAGYRRGRLRTPAPHARARRFYERRGWRTDGPPDDLWHFGVPLVTYRCELPS
jgi:GNAT superfamily N-acetyltransferase